MSKIEDGGPAFPSEYVKHARGEIGNEVEIMATSPGMSLRDWIAGQALIACSGINPNLPDDPAIGHWPEASELAERQARYAYLVADAMLAERDK